MREFRWEVKNFARGMHADMARAGEGAESYARDAAGVRVDGNGFLRPRIAFRQFGDTGEFAVTGVIAGEDYLMTLRSNAALTIRFAQNPDLELPIVFDTPSDLAGALSLVSEYADFAIIKAQGGTPFWIDMREESTETYLHANRLGIIPPPVTARNSYGKAGVGEYTTYDEDGTAYRYEPVILKGFLYFYRLTYVRAQGSSASAIRDGNYLHEGFLFSGMESNPSPVMGFYSADPDVNLREDIVDNDGVKVQRITRIGGATRLVRDDNVLNPVFTANDLVAFHGLPQSDDPQVTGIMIYQSEPVEVEGDGRVNVDALQYRRIAYLPRGVTDAVTQQVGTEERWPDQPLMRFNNDVMPDSQRMHLYNDRIFVVTAEGLHYSDIDGTVLRHWAFPKANAIRRSGVLDLVAHRGVLLFGGPTALHSLTGTSAFNFVVNRLGALGPVSAHAMQVLIDSVAFVGASGFYATDGINVQKISQALDKEFDGYTSTYGHCHQLPDDTSIFVAQQRHEVERPRRVTYHFDEAWFSWPRFNIHQIATWQLPDARVMMADQTFAVRELLWKVTTDIADDDAMDSEDYIDWHWQSQRLNFGSEDLKSFRELQIQGQALSLVPARETRWDVNTGDSTVASGFVWRMGGDIVTIGGETWGSAEVPVRVRLTVWIDDGPPSYHVFEMTRDEYRPLRIRLNRKGRAIQIRLEGRGHLILKSLRIVGGMR